MLQIKKPSENMGGLLKLWAVPASVVVVTGKTVSFTETTSIYEIY